MKTDLSRTGASKALSLFLTSGSLYFLIEVLWKTFFSHSAIHWSMFILGGICGLAVGGLNEYIPWDWSVIHQGIVGALIITAAEFVFGCILNLWLHLGIWDYSHLPLNILGQVCLPFSAIWFVLSIVIIFLDDYLRYKWYGEEKPHYHLI